MICGPEKEQEIEKSVSVHLGKLYRAFLRGDLDGDSISYMDQTCFKVGMDSKTTLEISCGEHVKYCEEGSGGENFTMMVRVSCEMPGIFESPFMIFQNQKQNYLTQGVPDDVTGISYRTDPKGWIDQRVIAQMLKESSFLSRHPSGKKQIIFIENGGSHNVTDRNTRNFGSAQHRASMLSIERQDEMSALISSNRATRLSFK